jgi:hypothetical protein
MSSLYPDSKGKGRNLEQKVESEFQERNKETRRARDVFKD